MTSKPKLGAMMTCECCGHHQMLSPVFADAYFRNAVRDAMRKCVPDENGFDEYARTGGELEEIGWNACRGEMLRRLDTLMQNSPPAT